jgi:CheY-like chemotaxis protein
MADEAIILQAEDSEDDAFLCQRALSKIGGLKHRCIHVYDGEQCIKYLAGEEPYSDRKKFPFPNLLLLDLKMPILSGFDVLQWLSERPEFSALPVIILSGSERTEDRETALSRGAKEYQIKPIDTAELVSVMEAIGARWLKPPTSG